MLKLKDFGSALVSARNERGYSLANLAKHMGGISKQDIREWEEGLSAPGKLEIKQLVICLPRLRIFEQPLRAGDYEHTERPSEVRIKCIPDQSTKAPANLPTPNPSTVPAPSAKVSPLPSAAGRMAPTKMSATRAQTNRIAPAAYRARPAIQIVNPLPPEPLSAKPFAQALRRTRVEMLADLAGMVKKRLGSHTAEDHDFTIKTDGHGLVVKMQLAEGEDTVDSGCYIAVGPRGTDGLGVFCKTMTSGNYSDMLPRVNGVTTLLEIAKMLHTAVKDRRFE